MFMYCVDRTTLNKGIDSARGNDKPFHLEVSVSWEVPPCIYMQVQDICVKKRHYRITL